MTAQVAASIGVARARQQERERSERLAELDRVKTELFSNVSHELRTPLTLLLGPLEDVLARGALPAAVQEELEIAARNGRRLRTLVGSLLDFSAMEAGRLRAHLEPTDLGALTADIASVFRSAAERAGLALRVECDPLPEPVWVDREMWEKVVSNLLSNALKFTFDGEIAVEVRAAVRHAELVVRDTGVGIPEGELPHLFERFHRVRGARARTHEGAGIGLSLVHELVRRHHGRVRVRSIEGAGTTFTVWVPLGARPAPSPEPVGERPATQVAAALAEEAARWDPGPAPAEAPPMAPEPARRVRQPGARVLVADDNADMRDYLRRLLSEHWRVDLARDGREALARARAERPALVLADVMMPELDGFALLEAVRADPELAFTPVILVTARAGEESVLEGLAAGADDYLVKPFSPRELVARVSAQLELARERQETARELRETLELHRVTIEASQLGTWDLDVETMECRLSRTMTALMGYAPEDAVVPAARWQESVVEADRAPVLETLARAVESGDVFTIEFRIRVPGGERRLASRGRVVSGDDGPPRIVGATIDITALDRAREALRAAHDRLEERVAAGSAELRRSEERYRALVEASAQLVWTTDPEGRVTEDSPSWRAFTGQTLEQWLGDRRFDAVHPDDRERARRQWREVHAGVQPAELHHRLWHAASASWREARVRAVPLFDEAGGLRGWVGTATVRSDTEQER